MDLGLRGRVAMIAAASKGIGRACAEALAGEGCNVSICGRDRKSLDSAHSVLKQAGVSVHSAVADVGIDDDLIRWHRETVDRMGDVDILVTNTGGPPVARFLELSDAQWVAGVETTLMNVVRLTRMVVPGMQKKRWGRILHLTSLVARQPIDELTISSTLRAGLSGLTKTMSNQFGPDGITVNAILMGNIQTDRQRHLIEYRTRLRGIDEAEYLHEITSEIPLRRIGEPMEVGRVAAFLASDAGSYVTGVSLPVDGGVIRGTM